MTASGPSSFRPRAFVVMPFGKKEVPKNPRIDSGEKPAAKEEPLQVDFDAVYEMLFLPALQTAGLQPYRADDEEAAGDILKDMFAELVTADFVLADISILNANVFYELGIRHTVGPRGVICLHAGWAARPFDVAPQRTFKYDGQLFRVGLTRDPAWERAVAAEAKRLSETLRKAVAADRTTEGSPVYSNLPNLVPPNASGLGTARFKHYEKQSEEWAQRIVIAARDGRAEDILTLAGDMPSPYSRRKLLRQSADSLLALGRFAQAEKIYQDLWEDIAGSGSMEEWQVKGQLALLANRLGRTREAAQELKDLVREIPGVAESQGLLGRVYKDMWRQEWIHAPDLEQRLQLACRNAALARKSLATYEIALRRDLDSYYNGINVVTLAVLLDHAACTTKRRTKPALADLEDLQTVVRLAANARIGDESECVWARATLGELHLVLRQAQEALEQYEQATADPGITWFNLLSMLEQVQLFQFLDYDAESIDPVVALLEERMGALPNRPARFDKIALCSGHMIDTPDRPAPRFPERKADAVRARIAQQLEQWKIGPGDLAICGGACGADILFAEECVARGAQLRLLLAQEVDAFVGDSVRRAGNDWVRRFHALRDKAEAAIQPERLGQAPNDVSIYARTNLWMINTARVEAIDPGKIFALLVWDEKPAGDGPGGTSDFRQKICLLGGQVEIINPTKIP